MTNESNVLRSVALAASASLVLFAVGCGRQETAPPAAAPLFTSAEIKPAPNPVPAQVVVVSPNVSVSEELVAACKLNLNNVDSAPKFDFDQSALVAQDNAVLSQIANYVTNGPLAGRALDLVGRADPRGKGEYNMALGGRRASSVLRIPVGPLLRRPNTRPRSTAPSRTSRVRCGLATSQSSLKYQ